MEEVDVFKINDGYHDGDSLFGVGISKLETWR